MPLLYRIKNTTQIDLNVLFHAVSSRSINRMRVPKTEARDHLEPLDGSSLTVHPAANGDPVETLGR